jgi:sporulation protein YlmC with PRC-barrel domain
MRKMMIFLTAMTLIAFTYMSTSVFAEGMKDPMGKTHEAMSACIGKEVRNTEGEHLGTIQDFVLDPEGRITFAIVSHGGFLGFFEKKVAIPYSALTCDEGNQYYTSAVSKDRFANAPTIEDETNLHDRSFAEEMYRYFGQQPYWTEESTGMSE